MKYIKLLCIWSILFISVNNLTGCKKLLGLEKQSDWNFKPHVLDPHINKTAWDFLKERANGPAPADTVLKLMYQAIKYSGIDTNLYLQNNKTFILLHNDAILRLTNGLVTKDCYFGYHLSPTTGLAGTKWEDYPKDSVKNWLLYLIADGAYSFGKVGPTPIETTTLLPKGADPKNPESKILFSVVNDQNMKFSINDFVGSGVATQARTAGIVATNGTIHVVDRVVDYIEDNG